MRPIEVDEEKVGRDGPADDWSVQRRRLLQAAGAAAALTALGGTASAAGGDDEKEGKGYGKGGKYGRPRRGKRAIDPNLGYVALTPDERLPVEPDHEVQILINPPSDPENPIPEFYYQPTGLAVDVGDVVAFRYVTPGHTVSSYHPYAGRQLRVPEREDGGLAFFSSPYLGAGATWLYCFDRPGVYDYYCAPHEIFGHVGRIVVGEATETPPVPDPCAPPEPPEPPETEEGTTENGEGGDDGDGGAGGEPELRPPAFTAAIVLRDEALDPQNIVDEGAVLWEDVAPENKQLFVQVVPPEVCSVE
ncbi:cupredoxin domain-containing protein [Halomarina rubra]|uniref:Plastocyanin/azurin family copper-binding protein n=1 Tax=Halomarina rubra TaxID=2071873 RepID=A0ABD6B182_9EURY|nr:plastocyanin/azurin family copper-binding protein [Halomarina rubra]